MVFFQDLLSLTLGSIKLNLLLPDSHDLLPNAACAAADQDAWCRDDAEALRLKLAAIAAILVSSLAGIALPLVGNNERRRFLRTDGNLFAAAKAFAAGVILATGFVHMLPDGASNLTDPCLPEHPWSDFPFSGLFAMGSALLTLLVDFVGTQVYEKRRTAGRVHAVHDRHSHPVGCDGGGDDDYAPGPGGSVARARSIDEEEGEGHFGHLHSHVYDEEGDEEVGASRHVVVSQVLEMGIVSHSVIIGLSLGVSHSPGTIRPLIGALSFHQFFEGFALGGCISQANFNTLSTLVMACFFTLTTPAGIAIGIAIASSYNPDSARALIVEGILDCVSAGILIYMSLVDLIAADFMSKQMKCNVRLQIVSYFALFLGAGLMSLLAIWA